MFTNTKWNFLDSCMLCKRTKIIISDTWGGGARTTHEVQLFGPIQLKLNTHGIS